MSAEDVHAVVNSVPELRIEADRSSWSRETKRAVFEDEVVLVRGDVSLSCQRLELHHDEAGAVEKAIAMGNVQIVRDAWSATGERAELDQASGQLVLVGTVRMEEDGKILQGERLSIALEGDSVSCENCTFSVGAN